MASKSDVGIARRVGIGHADPGQDVAPIRAGSLHWSAWLEQTGNEGNLLRALPAGSLKVEQVR